MALLLVAGLPSFVVVSSVSAPYVDPARLQIWLPATVGLSVASGLAALVAWRRLPRLTDRGLLRAMGLLFGLPMVIQWGSVGPYLQPVNEHGALIMAMAVLVAAVAVFAASGAAGAQLTVAMVGLIVLPNYVVFATSFGFWSLPAMLVVYGVTLTVAAGTLAHAELKARERLVSRTEQLFDRVSRERADLSEMNEELRFRATHDRLMGIPNRELLQSELEQVIEARSPGEGVVGEVGLLFLDLDRFKFVNDTLGHTAGDSLLVMVGSRIESALDGEDALLARVGGDELVVLMRCLESKDHLGLVADKLLAKFVDPFTIEGVELSIGTSIGMVESQVGDTAEDLYRHADAALYEAKQRGRGRAVLADDELRSRRKSQVRTELALRTSLREREIEAWFQPEVELVTGRIVALEALARWRVGDDVAVASSFIDIAHRAGLLEPLMHEMLDQVWHWQAAFDTDMPIGINIHAAHLPALLEAHRLDPIARPLAGLRIEISEADLLNDLDETRSQLAQARALGASIVLDNFGSGAASLLSLSDLPIDVIKIDRAYVHRIETDVRIQTLITSLADFGRTCGIEVVAEGVETADQADFLSRIGVDRGQGRLYSPAVHPEAFKGLVEVGFAGGELVAGF